MRGLSRLFYATVSLLLSSTYSTAEPIGSVVDVSTRVMGTGTGGNREILQKSSIYLDDNLKSDANGNAQIKFVDGTKLTVGPGALLTIDELIYSDSRTFKKLTISAVQGVFRFATGSSNKQAYQINTPVGTMGVRGTAFDLTVHNSEAHVTVVHGSVRLCSSSGSCQDISGRCSYAVMNRSGVSLKGNLRDRPQSEKNTFPLLANQSQLNAGFRHSGGSCVATAFRIEPKTPPAPPGRRASLDVAPPEPAPAQNRSGKGDGTNPGNGFGNGNNQGANNPNNSGGNGQGKQL